MRGGTTPPGRPDEVRCTAKHNVGTLVLVPFVPLENISANNASGNSLSLGVHLVGM